MVNYLYDLDDIEKNHEAYAERPAGSWRRARCGACCAGAAAELVPVPCRDNSGFPSIRAGFILCAARNARGRP